MWCGVGGVVDNRRSTRGDDITISRDASINNDDAI
jgi:hypothetical protein